VPGAQAQCACPNGGKGVQVCSDAGDRYDPCDCRGVHPVAAPVAATSEPPRMVRRSPGGFTVGLALTIIGGVAFSVGSAWLITQATSDYQTGCTDEDYSTTECVVAGAIGVVGVAGLAVGIPMMISGGQSVPASPDATQAAWWVPATVAVGRSGARIGWTF
jgi:hypothetical protein